MISFCKLCLINRDLQKSHAISDSFFKRIFRKYSGKAITFSKDEDYINYSSDSWWEHQLCSGCESDLNRRYEDYSLQVLRGRRCDFSKTEFGLSFRKIDLHKLNMFFLSIFWRAANSNHEAYKNVVMLDEDNEFLRRAILNDKGVPISRMSVKVERLCDTSYSGGFKEESLKELIVSPFCRVNKEGGSKSISICFIFEGFYVQIFMPGLSLKKRKAAGVINKSNKNLFVPYVNLLDIVEVLDAMADGYGKHIAGKTNVRS